MTSLLQAKAINKSFGEGKGRKQVLKNISASIQNQDFIAIMGPSGSGKSTLLFAISGMDTIDSGQVLFQNQDLAQLSERNLAQIRRQEMGFVFQQAGFIPQISLIDNIVLASYNDYPSNKKALYQKAKTLMAKVGIDGLEQRLVSQVSGGQLQRAAICRAILHQPKLLFADEPTGALNSQNSQDILTLFTNLNAEGMTIVLVTHDPMVAAKAKRILFMKDGQIESDLQFTQEGTNQKFQTVLSKMADLGI